MSYMLVIDDPALFACLASRLSSGGSHGLERPLSCLIVARRADAPSVVDAIRRDECKAVNVRITQDPVAHALLRWATLVVSMRDSQEDLPTLEHWRKYVGKSVGTLVNWCSTARVTSSASKCPSASKQFGRVLRAILWARVHGVSARPQDLLVVHDLRTMHKLMTCAGSDDPDRLPTLEQFLSRQQFVTNQAAVVQVAALLGVSLQSAYQPGGMALGEGRAEPSAARPGERARSRTGATTVPDSSTKALARWQTGGAVDGHQGHSEEELRTPTEKKY